MARFAHDFAGLGQLVPWQAGQAELDRFEVDHAPAGEVIQEGGKDGGDHDLGVGHAEKFGHDEGGRPHYRRHDLAARGGHRFDSPGELRPVTDAFHEGDGERAGGGDVGDGAAVDRAEQAAGEDGHFGRAAGRAAGDGHGQGVEEFGHARLRQEGAEEDEQEDVRGRDAEGDAVNTFCREEHVLDDPVEAIAAMAELAGDHIAEQGIGDEDEGHDRQLLAGRPAGGLKHQQTKEGADPDVHAGVYAAGVGQIIVDGDEINAYEYREGGQHDIHGRYLVFRAFFAGRVEKEDKYEHKGEVDAALLYRLQHAETGGIQMEKRHSDGDDGDDFGEDAGELAEAGLGLVLAQYFFGRRRRFFVDEGVDLTFIDRRFLFLLQRGFPLNQLDSARQRAYGNRRQAGCLRFPIGRFYLTRPFSL